MNETELENHEDERVEQPDSETAAPINWAAVNARAIEEINITLNRIATALVRIAGYLQDKEEAERAMDNAPAVKMLSKSPKKAVIAKTKKVKRKTPNRAMRRKMGY